jgi:4-amino-4-deoxy-L-arabinose transferase-like glycosyltransferase
VAILGCVVVLAALLRLATLGQQSFWFDESMTYFIIHGSPAAVLDAISAHEVTPPLYYYLAWAWTHVFSSAEFGLRSLSAVAGIATVGVAYLIGKELSTRRTGLVLAVLVAVNPLLVWYSQESRAYSLLVLTSAVSFLFFVRSLHKRSVLNLAGWALFSILAFLTHYFGLFLVGVECALLFVSIRRLRDLATTFCAAAAVGAVGLAILPFAVQQRDAGGGEWIASIALKTRVIQIPQQFMVGFGSVARPVAVLACACLVAIAIWLVIFRTTAVEKRGAALALTVGVLSLAVPFALTAFDIDYMSSRNVIAAWVPLAAGVACGVSATKAPRLGLATVAALCLVSLFAVGSVIAKPQLQRADWRAITHKLSQPSGVSRAVVLMGYQSGPIQVYLPSAKKMPDQGTSVTEVDVLDGKGSASCFWGATCYHPWPSQDPVGTPAPGFSNAGSDQLSGVTITRFSAATPQHVTPTQISQRFPKTRVELLYQPGPAK